MGVLFDGVFRPDSESEGILKIRLTILEIYPKYHDLSSEIFRKMVSEDYLENGKSDLKNFFRFGISAKNYIEYNPYMSNLNKKFFEGKSW